MKKWFLFFTLFFVMVNIAIPSAAKNMNYFSDTTTDVEEIEEIEKEIPVAVYSPSFSVLIAESEFITSLAVFIPTYFFKIFIPPSL